MREIDPSIENPTLSNPNDPAPRNSVFNKSGKTRGGLFSANFQRGGTGKFSVASSRFSFFGWGSTRSVNPVVEDPSETGTAPIQEASTTNGKPKSLKLGNFNFVGAADNKKRFSKKLVACNIVMIGTIVALFLFLAASSNNNNDASSQDGSCVNVAAPEPSRTSCGSDSIDRNIRVRIRDQITIDRLNGVADLIGAEGITCLPQKAFDELSADQRNDIDQVFDLEISTLALREIKEGAFDHEFLTNINRLSLANNGLRSLPDNVFGQMTSLDSLSLNNNAFATLDNDIFGDGRRLLRISLVGNTGLVKFPGFFGFHERVGDLDFTGTTSLVTFDEGSAKGAIATQITTDNSRFEQVFSSFDDFLEAVNLIFEPPV